MGSGMPHNVMILPNFGLFTNVQKHFSCARRSEQHNAEGALPSLIAGLQAERIRLYCMDELLVAYLQLHFSDNKIEPIIIID